MGHENVRFELWSIYWRVLYFILQFSGRPTYPPTQRPNPTVTVPTTPSVYRRYLGYGEIICIEWNGNEAREKLFLYPFRRLLSYSFNANIDCKQSFPNKTLFMLLEDYIKTHKDLILMSKVDKPQQRKKNFAVIHFFTTKVEKPPTQLFGTLKTLKLDQHPWKSWKVNIM